MITIIDYGLGNVRAFLNLYKRLNIPVRTARTAEELEGSERVILPGVGAFDHAMELLDASGMRATLDRLVRAERVPVLGICVGMQMLAERSNEGERAGLAYIPGEVRRFTPPADLPLPLPHMGWNDARPVAGHPLFAQLEQLPRFYFLHSYYFACERADDVAAEADYGRTFACAVSAGNVHGVQFHPEKSHRWGERLLQNFASA
ncbi:MAG: imidazole glycerol phosphate synthase subunit HisH [Gemmatimonadota bacterium]